jgi:HNH endonuclease
MATATYWFTPEQLEKIINRIQPQENGCWHYPAVTSAKGYAITRIGWPVTKGAFIHRLSWIYYKGDIPENMVLDHLCHDTKTCAGGNSCVHRRCVNPNHLQLVTLAKNSQNTSRLLKNKTHCIHGHALENNIYKYGKNRQSCLTCSTIQKDAYHLRRKEKKVK